MKWGYQQHAVAHNSVACSCMSGYTRPSATSYRNKEAFSIRFKDVMDDIILSTRLEWNNGSRCGIVSTRNVPHRLLHGNLCHSKQPRQSTAVICAIDSNDAPCHVDSLSVSVSIKGSHTRFDTRIASLAASALLVVLFVCRCVGDTISGSSSNGGSCSGSCSSSGWFGWGLR